MNRVLSLTRKVLILICLLILGGIFVKYYPVFFARTVTGPITKLRKISVPLGEPNAISQEPILTKDSYDIGVEDSETGEIVISSSEDREWASVEAGQCATVKFFPYPPWQVERIGTYEKARLIHLKKECPGQAVDEPAEPAEAHEP